MKIENMSPRRKARERKLLRNTTLLSLIPVIMSIVFVWYGVFLVSIVVTFLTYVAYSYFLPDEDYGPAPWWYFGL